jgi:hypothetical protein
MSGDSLMPAMADTVKKIINSHSIDADAYEKAFGLVEKFFSLYSTSFGILLAFIGLVIPGISFFLTFLNQRRLKLNAEQIRVGLLSEIRTLKKELSEEIKKEFEDKMKKMEDSHANLSKMTRNNLNIIKTKDVFDQSIAFYRDLKYANAVSLLAKAYQFSRKIDPGYSENENLKRTIGEVLVSIFNETKDLNRQQFNPYDAKILETLESIDKALEAEYDVNLDGLKSTIKRIYQL